MQAKFIRGNPEFARYKPAGAVSAGDVVIVGDLVTVAHSDIAAAEWGNVAVGGGVYEVVAGAALAVGIICEWDDTPNKVVATTAGDKVFGFVNLHLASTGDDDVIECLHRPTSGAA